MEKKPLPHMLAVTNMLLHNVEDPSFLRHDNTLARPYISWGRDDRVDIVLTNPPFGGKEEPGSSSAGESHPHALTEPDVSLSAHPALIVQPLVEAWSNVQRAAGRVERPVQATCGLGEAHGAWIYTSAASTSPRSG